jgi:hypothetical protein
MNFESLRHLEKSLVIKLPTEYSKFMLDYPLLSDSQEHRYLEETILRDVELIIQDNEYFREEIEGLVKDTFDLDLTWENYYLIVGSDGCGNHYFLDTSKSPAPVYFFDHESGLFEFIAGNISGLFKYFIDVYHE